nr:Abi family protein [Limosilactobacillus agrestimuris]
MHPEKFKYGSVPLWVLVNFLTFGDLNYFYTNCFSEIQKIIAKDFHDLKSYTYGNKHQAAITPSAICQINKMESSPCSSVMSFNNYRENIEKSYILSKNEAPTTGCFISLNRFIDEFRIDAYVLWNISSQLNA